MELTVLGCGDAFGNDGRNNTSFLFRNDNEGVLIDCGATTLLRLKHEDVQLESISTIIISHFHGDHFGGIPFFVISSLFEYPRTKSLTIVGPEGVESRVKELQDAMYKGTAEKLDQLDLTFLEYDEEKPLQFQGKVIKVCQVEHSPPSLPHAIRLEWDGKVVAFSGDTSWTDKLVPISEGADLFICECNFMNEVSFGHLGYHELISKQSQFNVGQLWLTHMANKVIYSEEVKLNRLSDGQRISF